MRSLSIPAVFLAVLASFAAAQRLPPELAGAEGELREADEQATHRGGKACLEADSVSAAELLLEVMDREGRLSRRHFEAGHYRDLVFDYIKQLTDPYARERVAQEIGRNRKNAFARQWAAEALGFFGDHAYGDALVRALADRDDGVRRWAAWSAGRIRYPHAGAKLERLCRDRDDFVRANAIEALARIDVAYTEQFIAACSDDDSAGVRCALLGAAPEVVPDHVEPVSLAGSRDEDWRPRLRAVDNLGAIRSKVAVDTLIEATADGRPIVVARAHDALQKLTGEPIRQADVWRKWWADNRETFTFPERAGEARRKSEGVTFAGIVVDSDHVAFVLDKSYLMKRPSKASGGTYDDLARRELAAVLDKLESDVRFNVYTYDEDVRTLARKPVVKSAKTVKHALRFAAAEPSGRYKDMWKVLEHVVMQPDIDTVYFISSGEADVGLYCHGNRIGRHLHDLNRFYNKTVNAIAFTADERYRWHVEQVALATGGTFKSFN